MDRTSDERLSRASETGGELLVDALVDWGVSVVFGLPGDGINGVMEGLRKRRDRIRFVQVRHEEAAAFMAVGYAKYTGKLGVCLATSGPGGVHLLNGLYDAKMDKMPVLAITGEHYHDLADTYAQQDVALDRVFADVAVYNTQIMGASHVVNAVDAACRHALGYRGVAHINFPADLQRQKPEKDKPSERNKPHHSSGLHPAVISPSPGGLAKAAELLNAARRPVLLVGRGALGASAEVEKVAEMLGAPVVKALLGKAVLADDHPLTTGGIGLLGTKPSVLAMEGCDALLIAGSSFPYIEFYPKPGQAKIVQIDTDPARIGLRCAVDVPLVADVREALGGLLPLLRPKADRSFLSEIQAAKREWDELLVEQGRIMSMPMKPQVVAAALGRALPKDAMISWDSGTNTFWAARYLPARLGTLVSGSGLMASMACALPYANAAAIAYPGRTSIAFAGDGGMSMLLGELATTAKYKLNVKIVVISNGTLGQIKWEQMAFEGNPEYGVELEPVDFAKVAEAHGIRGLTLSDPREAERTVAELLATPGPALLHAIVDPLEPPMPPKLSGQQKAKFQEALARGEPDAAEIMANVKRDLDRAMV